MSFAAFFDILGTSAYFTSLSDDHDFTKDGPYTGYNYARSEFHRAIEAATSISKTGFRFRASFSDCAYLVFDDPRGVLLAARVVMSWLYSVAPVRGGIGKGNFGLGRTLHSSDPYTSSSEASFFGSALVRAHEAEACGLKGFRVFVHSSATSELLVPQGNMIVYPEDYQRSDEPELASRPETLPATVVPVDVPCAAVTHELCFIGDESVDLYFRGLEMLEKTFPPDDGAQVHYEQSKLILERFEALRNAI